MPTHSGTPAEYIQEYRNQESLTRRVNELRAQLEGVNLAQLAGRTGAHYAAGSSELHLSFFGDPVVITTPEYMALDSRSGEQRSLTTLALLLYYLTTSNGAPLAGRWISFRELPNGGFYHQAFQNYTGREIHDRLGSDLVTLERAALNLGGKPEEIGDAAFSFAALPRVHLLVVTWLGDEDFPSSTRILFDAAAGHHLPADACAVLGSMLTRKLTS